MNMWKIVLALALVAAPLHAIEPRDPFARVSPDGDVEFGDQVVEAERFSLGFYRVEFTRPLNHCVFWLTIRDESPRVGGYPHWISYDPSAIYVIAWQEYEPDGCSVKPSGGHPPRKGRDVRFDIVTRCAPEPAEGWSR